MKYTAIAIAIAAFAAPLGGAVSFDLPRASLFGITLGSQLSLPNCPESYDAPDSAYKGGLCLGRDDSADGAPVRKLVAKFADDALPDFRVAEIIGGDLYLSVSDQGVEGILFYTDGVEGQGEVFKLLRKKFGRPFMYWVETESNAMGAKVKVMNARWTVGTDVVFFSGALDRIDVGSIEAMTFAELKRREADDTARRAKQPAL